MDSGELNAGPTPFMAFMLALGAAIRAMDLLPPVARSSDNLFETFENALDSFERRYRASHPDADHELFEAQVALYHKMLVACLEVAVDDGDLPDDLSLRLVHNRDDPKR